jgi:hypothetical protein
VAADAADNDLTPISKRRRRLHPGDLRRSIANRRRRVGRLRFGPVAVQAWFDDTVQCQDAICGLDVWARMSFKIWGPDAPKPLVAKN